MTAPWYTTCPARPATASTLSWRPTRDRSASSTPPACGARAASTGALSTSRSCGPLQSIDRADAALLVVDAAEGVTHQDQRLAERVDAAGSPVVIVLNKWETLDAERRAAGTADNAPRPEFLRYPPGLKISAPPRKGGQKLVAPLGPAHDAHHPRGAAGGGH